MVQLKFSSNVDLWEIISERCLLFGVGSLLEIWSLSGGRITYKQFQRTNNQCYHVIVKQTMTRFYNMILDKGTRFSINLHLKYVFLGIVYFKAQPIFTLFLKLSLFCRKINYSVFKPIDSLLGKVLNNLIYISKNVQ